MCGGFEQYQRTDKMLIQATKKLRDENIIKTRAAILKVDLDLGEYEAWRKVIVPLNYNFHQLHKIIQKLYNWQDYHLHEFFVYSEEKDVGGVGSFADFMHTISNPDDEDYKIMKEWAESQRFSVYDSEKIINDLKLHF